MGKGSQSKKPAKAVAEEPKIEIPKLGLVTGTNIPRTRNKVCIIGFAPTSMTDAQFHFDDPDMEFWGLNQLYHAWPKLQEHATRWFQLHHRHSYDINVGRDEGHHKWMTKVEDFPIYMQDRVKDVPMSIKFPKDEIMEIFGNYFTNSISWMLSLAIAEGFNDIYIYGVDMAQESEYSYERPSVEFFVGWARGVGWVLRTLGKGNCRVHIPEKSDLCKTLWLYPFDDTAPFRAKIEARRKELRGRLDALYGQEMGAHDQRQQILGALDNMNYIKYSWESSVREMAVDTLKPSRLLPKES